MKGARALPSVKIMRSPRRASIITIGNSHQRLRVFIKSHNSFIIENLLKKFDRNRIAPSLPVGRPLTLISLTQTVFSSQQFL